MSVPAPGTQIHIAEPSVKSLLLKLRFSGQPLASGTGFVAMARGRPVLVTARHNVTGRRQDTGGVLSPRTAGTPNEVVIFHNRLGRLGEWVETVEPLYRGESPLWVEHPRLGAAADFVALPLTRFDDVEMYSYTLGIGDIQLLLAPAEPVSIVGFPFGLSAGGCLAIWATGFIATDVDIDFGGFPTFLVDCRSREGQSGSAVIAQRTGGAVTDAAGNVFVGNTSRTCFLGVYSGRVRDDSDLGCVWKASAIRELVGSMP